MLKKPIMKLKEQKLQPMNSPTKRRRKDAVMKKLKPYWGTQN
jgi:hypothetical protein